MKSSPDRVERALHHTQTFSNSCQPACMAMALGRRRSETVADIEARLHAGAAPAGHPVTERKWLNEPRTSLQKSTLDAAELEGFRTVLRRGGWVMVHVFGPRWVARLPKGVFGPHGALCPPADAARPLHSVLLVGFSAGCFFVLDPFFGPDAQPFEVAHSELRSVLSGFSSLVIEL